VSLWPASEDQLAWILTRGDFGRRGEILDRWPLRDTYAALHCWYVEHGIPVTSAAAMADDQDDFAGRKRRLARIARGV